jgi:hypothetical protein
MRSSIDHRRTITAVVAVVAASSLVRRSRLARLLLASAAVGSVYRRFLRSEPVWHDVEPPPPP